MKYYAVKKGLKTGIFDSWEETKEYVLNYNGAIYKSFSTKEDALNYLNDEIKEISYAIPTCYIDGSYDIKTKAYSFGGVLLIDDKELHFKKKYVEDEFSQFRNVAGEIKGAAFIINYLLKHDVHELNLMYDYEGIEAWWTNRWQASSKIAILYQKFRNKVYNDIKINFYKIKSHTNNKYNDLADKLAKEALGIA